jgi:5-amino-6-(5-phosphoribosylamino)uracil reductase
MPDGPYTLLSCGMSIDGYLGSAAPRRLELSNDADFDRVDAVRASCDAIPSAQPPCERTTRD